MTQNNENESDIIEVTTVAETTRVPVVKDPFWPNGAEPLHIQKANRELPRIVEEYAPTWKCMKCGATSHRDKKDESLCVDCARQTAQNTTMAIKTNANWMELASEMGLELFERQPEETDLEWRIWTTYRNYYPLKLPTIGELAAKAGCSKAACTKAMQKWSYKVRLIEWARFTDADVQEERIKAVREMNKKQLTMAQSIQEKLKVAIEYIKPETLKPNELVNLFKMATELETKITTYTEEKVDSTVKESGQKQKEITKTEDISEIIAILQQTGMLKDKQIGVETTTTTRVIAKESDQ